MTRAILLTSLFALGCSSEETTRAPSIDSGTVVDVAMNNETSAPECGKQGTFVGSCTRATSNECDEFTGAGWTVESAKSGCSAGTFSTMPCTRTGLVGRCLVFCGSPNEKIDYFYADAMDHMTKCAALDNVWVAE
jgi:hypothetical protein